MRRIAQHLISRVAVLGLTFGAILTGIPPAAAQTPDDRWQITLAPYLMGAAMNGTTVVRGREAEIDVSASEVFENLEFGFMGMVAARNGDWGFAGDIVYAALGVTIDAPPADIDPTQVIFTAQGLRRLSDAADLTFGLRVNHLKGRISFKGPLGLEVEQSKNWVDPVVGLILRTAGERRWHVTLIGDIGGFGAGSDFTWQLFPALGVSVTERLSLELGWRFLDTNYKTGEDNERFEYDVLTHGPALGFALRF
jgi:hypothetical protein